jgi:phage gp45-like
MIGWEEHFRALRQGVSRSLNGLKMMLGRGRIQMVINNDHGPVQMIQVQVSAVELMNLPRLAEFGFVSRAPKNSDCAIIFLNAERTWGIVVATGNQTARMPLANDGETAIHDANGENGAAGKWIWAKKGAGWEIECNGEPFILMDCSNLTASNKAGGTMPVTLNMNGGNVTLNLGGGNVTLNNPGTVVLGPAGKRVVMDGDPVVGGGGGTVQATQNVVKV